MPSETSINDVFRFIQLRPRLSLEETGSIPILSETKTAQTILREPNPGRRMEAANAALANRGETIRSVADVPLGSEITAAIAQLMAGDEATTRDLVQRLTDLDPTVNSPAFEEGRRALSNTLLAVFFATRGFPEDLSALQNAFRVYELLVQGRDDEYPDPAPLAWLLARPILVPVIESRVESSPPGRGRPARAEPQPAPDSLAQLPDAIAELAALDRPEFLVHPDEQGAAREATPFTLTPVARQRVSAKTLSVLKDHGIDLTAQPIDVAVQTLTAAKFRGLGKEIFWPHPVVTPQPGPSLPPAPSVALVRPAGIADLLVVKKQIKRYEAGEIAHVENVLIGEKKSRAHRQLERSEETFVTETEATRQRETELETADRFELNRETSRTIKEDQQISLGLTLSGKYGPTIEFSSNFQMDLSTSKEETAKSSSRYARDVVNRSLERVTERIREQRTRTVIRETEETNLHELNNETGAHVRGIYQFIDKVYEAQIFNYGLREMFDFMVPEPASFLWYVADNPTLDIDLPPPVPKLETVAPDASYINESNALTLAATYGVAGVEAPPPLYKMLTTGLKHGEDDASESGQPHSTQRVEVQIPAGYRPLRARVRGLAFTDENPVIAVVIGAQRAVWKPGSGDRVALSAGSELAHQPALFLVLSSDPYELTAESKLGVSALAWETNSYALDVVIVARRTEEELERWRISTYNKIRGGYDERVRQYEQKVEELRSAAEARAERESRRPFGAPPAENERTIKSELKKHCISIITQQRYDAFDATKTGTPPYFDFVEAAEEGAYIRFFEQAFEWDQMQWVFYPYFWARKTTWIDRFSKQDVDPEFLEFLKAGAARVVAPVRPGFEVAVTHFIETGKIWGGEGEPPQINSPLYVSIVDEIRERTGAPQGEIAVGEPWDVRVPTALVLVREEGDLPEWERVAPDQWEWRPVEA
jgi:hypothetical protein